MACFRAAKRAFNFAWITHYMDGIPRLFDLFLGSISRSSPNCQRTRFLQANPTKKSSYLWGLLFPSRCIYNLVSCGRLIASLQGQTSLSSKIHAIVSNNIYDRLSFSVMVCCGLLHTDNNRSATHIEVNHSPEWTRIKTWYLYFEREHALIKPVRW